LKQECPIDPQWVHGIKGPGKQEYDMSANKPWSPKIDSDPLFNPFTPPDGDKSNSTPTLLDPEEDTAPLQGTKDLSDPDSLEDVIADADGHVMSNDDTKDDAK
jgi:hypothetical protein